jgi:hypothetical protein
VGVGYPYRPVLFHAALQRVGRKGLRCDDTGGCEPGGLGDLGEALRHAMDGVAAGGGDDDRGRKAPEVGHYLV